MLRRAARLDLPVLFSRSSHPYQEIVTPGRETPAGVAAARAAIDLAAYGKGHVSGVSVVTPSFLTGLDGRESALRALTRLREEAAVQGVEVRRRRHVAGHWGLGRVVVVNDGGSVDDSVVGRQFD